MRITDALKPVTDALAAVGMSLDTATYKDGKIHATLSTEAPKATGRPGSGPEFPPEGYRLLDPWEKGSTGPLEDCFVWVSGHKMWFSPIRIHRYNQILAGLLKVEAVAVPIAPKPEPVKLTDQEKIVGWRGPNGFRLQTFQNREVPCAICKKTIKAGERLARWRYWFPESECCDHVVGHPEAEENHAHAHVDCLYKGARGLYVADLAGGLGYFLQDVPEWLQEKRRKYDKQHGTP